MIYFTQIESPVGDLLIVSNENSLKWIIFRKGKKSIEPKADWTEGRPEIIRRTIEQLEAYFAGELKEFDLDLAPDGTAFQLEVWRALCDIPYGETISYGDLARRIGRPKASRAVGAANGSNPLPIVVPCHRVIGASGALTGYGGGMEKKVALLKLEGNRAAHPRDRQEAFL